MGYIKKEKTVKQEVIVSVQCDCCGESEKCDETPGDWSKIPESWVEIKGRHWGWGSESDDSIEIHFACSPKCYIQVLENERNRLKDRRHHEPEVTNEMGFEFVENLLEHIRK
jgi:hypothetical protein